MRRISACVAAALLATPTLVSSFSTPPPGKAAPPVVPYLCSDGRPASVIYESGSNYRHAKARLTYDGRTIELRSAPTLSGVRYRSEADGEHGPALAWSLRGEEAWLTESPDEESYTRQERELARCVRVRAAVTTGAAHSDEGHSDDH